MQIFDREGPEIVKEALKQIRNVDKQCHGSLQVELNSDAKIWNKSSRHYYYSSDF